MLIVDSEWVGCGGTLPRIPFKELLLLSPAHAAAYCRAFPLRNCFCSVQRMTGRQLVLLSARLFRLAADLRLLISGASDSVFFLLLSAHESLLLAQWSLWH